MLDFSENYFTLFGLPEQFAVDMQLLNERYFSLQKVVHPDRHANATAQERRIALQEAGLVNEAMRILKDPLNRAAYILQRHGFTSTTSTTDATFLTAQLELREALAEVSNQPNPRQALADLIAQLDAQYQDMLTILAQYLAANSWGDAQEMLHKLQFLQRLRRSAADQEANLVVEGMGTLFT